MPIHARYVVFIRESYHTNHSRVFLLVRIPSRFSCCTAVLLYSRRPRTCLFSTKVYQYSFPPVSGSKNLFCVCVRVCLCWKVAYRVPGAPTADWVDIYNRLYRERIIFLGQEIDDELANQIIGVLLVRAGLHAFAIGARGGRGLFCST